MKRIALVGARGHTGAEIVRLLGEQPEMKLTVATTSSAAGAHVGNGVVLETLTPEQLASRDVDAVVLALHNGAAAPFVRALGDAQHPAVVVDVSADHRFDDAFVYGLPELYGLREQLRGARRIANPGCYATAAQIALAALGDVVDVTLPSSVFGVSGYSGAGTTPSPRNDPATLKDNLMPYSLVDHMHEREVERHAKRPVFFMPHVASFFRGLTVTVTAPLSSVTTADTLFDAARRRFAKESLVTVTAEAPLVRDCVGTASVFVGGFAVDARQRRAVVTATLDNLLKGAASQALQNLGLALGVSVLLDGELR
jgi:N-acetyl-gamma-glutamyl-phosphate reductase